MKTMRENIGRRGRAFTLIELLVVIAIIGILAGLLLSALKGAKLAAMKLQARTDMKTIETAIQGYHTAYNRYPCPTNVITADFTFGDTLLNLASTMNNFTGTNSELMAILLDDPDPTHSNAGHVKNPQQTPFMQLKRATSTNSPGLGPDLIFRDPWAHAYNITIDYDYDDQCRDSLYFLLPVSEINPTNNAGYNGLVRYKDGVVNGFVGRMPVMVWSSGPDGQATNNAPANRPDSSNPNVNQDNILSWTK